MKRLKKSKRVSWASGAKLFQVKSFLSEDRPSKVGKQAQDRPEAKAPVSCLKNMYSDNHHSRFEGRYSMDPLKQKLSHIAQIKWKCPPKFVLSDNWHVAAGDESKEAETQKHREMRVLEAVYPRLFDIPPSPYLPLDMEEDHLDDSHIPSVPIIPIEEAAVDLPSDLVEPKNASFDSQSLAVPQGLLSGNPNAPQCDPQPHLNTSANEKPAPEVLSGFQADAVVAVVAAVTAIMKTEERGSSIDTDLLIKLLTDPKMIEKLNIEKAARANTRTEPLSGSKPLSSSKPGLVEEVVNDDGALGKTGSTFISESNLGKPLVAIPCPKPDPVIKRVTNELGEAANTRAPPIAGSKPKPVTPPVALPSPKPDPVNEKLIQKHRAPTDTGAAPLSGSKLATPPVSLPSPKPDPVNEKRIQKHRATIDTGAALVSGSNLVIPSLSLPSPKPDPGNEKLILKHTPPTDKPVVPVSRSNPASSGVDFPSQRYVPVVKKSIHEQRRSAPFSVGKLCTPTAALPSLNQGGIVSAQELARIKRNICAFGTLGRTGNEPVSMSMPLSPQVPLVNPLPDMVFPGRTNLHPLPNIRETGLLKALSPDHARPNLNTLPYLGQPSLQVKALSPDSVPISSFSPISSLPAKDVNYMKSLVRQHGDVQETRDYYNLSQSGNSDFQLQDQKPVTILKPNESTPKVRMLQKPCIYFNSSRGCRNGSCCLYRHDMMPKNLQPGGVLEAPSSKRMKLGGEITGRT